MKKNNTPTHHDSYEQLIRQLQTKYERRAKQRIDGHTAALHANMQFINRYTDEILSGNYEKLQQLLLKINRLKSNNSEIERHLCNQEDKLGDLIRSLEMQRDNLRAHLSEERTLENHPSLEHDPHAPCETIPWETPECTHVTTEKNAFSSTL